MAQAHHTLNTAGAGLRAAPVLTVAVFALPIAAGLVGTLLPAIGGGQWSLDPWRALFASSGSGFALSLQAKLVTGWAATLLSVVLACGIAAVLHHRAAWSRLGRWLAPVLAMPHSALALAFLLVPSGWLVRWISPGLTGWAVPPDVATVGHASG